MAFHLSYCNCSFVELVVNVFKLIFEQTGNNIVVNRDKIGREGEVIERHIEREREREREREKKRE